MKNEEMKEIEQALKERPEILELLLLVGNDDRLIEAALSAINKIKQEKRMVLC